MNLCEDKANFPNADFCRRCIAQRDDIWRNSMKRWKISEGFYYKDRYGYLLWDKKTECPYAGYSAPVYAWDCDLTPDDVRKHNCAVAMDIADNECQCGHHV